MYTWARWSPASSASNRSRSWPERPTNGRPCRSSSRPGPSPTTIRSACGSPSPKTTVVRPAASGQRVHARAIRSTSASPGTATHGIGRPRLRPPTPHRLIPSWLRDRTVPVCVDKGREAGEHHSTTGALGAISPGRSGAGQPSAAGLSATPAAGGLSAPAARRTGQLSPAAWAWQLPATAGPSNYPPPGSGNYPPPPPGRTTRRRRPGRATTRRRRPGRATTPHRRPAATPRPAITPRPRHPGGSRVGAGNSPAGGSNPGRPGVDQMDAPPVTWPDGGDGSAPPSSTGFWSGS